jgi:hypothetical protein
VATRPFIFSGKRLSLNLATSAAGWVRVKLIGQGRTLHSIELFGDNPDRDVAFEDGEVADLIGKPVTLELTMSDADLYSFQFV